MMGVCSLRLIHDRPCTQNLFRRHSVHRLKDEWGLNLLSNVSMQKTVSQTLNTRPLVLEIHTYKSDPAQSKVSNTIVRIVIDTFSLGKPQPMGTSVIWPHRDVTGSLFAPHWSFK